ncbi:hypothetical protein [Streptomyces sp. NPDC096324]|uniref:hypothetical protein n=1 Tax=Streptomyces sp. NPDC096324 TaxID=3366085 RepID=UPI00381AB8A6
MDPEVVALATTFGGAIVAAMATDAWQETRTRVLDIWQRFQPDRAQATEQMLQMNRSELMRLSGDSRSQFERLLSEQWHSEAVTLMQMNPAAIRALAESLRAPQANQASIRQSGYAHNNSRIFMAGQDQNFFNSNE